MPYFVYELSPPRSLKRLECFQNYREARAAARALRQALPADSGRSVRVIFAADEAQAEALLREKREPRPLGEDA